MNYKEINTAILGSKDINEKLVKKDEQFYRYLFNNKVAYYYATQLSKRQTEKEKWIIKRGNELNARYIKTLEFVRQVCDENNIEFILFKTHKVIPEVVDGDIDLIVHKKDFQKFLDIFSELGFNSVEDEPGKGKCVKEGCNVIEPHITISWRGNSYFDEKELWKYTKEVNINNKQYLVSSDNIETFIAIAQLFYEPEYIDLYTMFQLKASSTLIQSLPHHKQVQFFIDNVNQQRSVAFPVFAPLMLFMKLWTKELFVSKNLKTYLLHCIFYVYWRLRYKFIKKLPFTHIW